MTSITQTELLRFVLLKNIVKKGEKTFIEVGNALLQIRDERLYRENYNSFEDFCQDEWGWGQKRASQLIVAAQNVKALPESLSTIVESESVARQLSRLPKPAQIEILKEAKKTGKKITAAKIPPPASSKKPAQPVEEIVCDGTGLAISKKLQPFWNRAGEVQELLTSISKVRAALKRFQDCNDPLFGKINYSTVLCGLDSVFAELKTAKPFAVCTLCQGKIIDGCAFCKGTGFISEFSYKTHVPQEERDMRDKIVAKQKEK